MCQPPWMVWWSSTSLKDLKTPQTLDHCHPPTPDFLQTAMSSPRTMLILPWWLVLVTTNKSSSAENPLLVPLLVLTDTTLDPMVRSRRRYEILLLNISHHNSFSFQMVTLDEKLSGVRAKIALFSNENGKNGPHSKNSIGKYQSTEDVGKLVGSSGSLTRAHTHSDVRFDAENTATGGLKPSRQSVSQMSLKSLKTEDRGGKDNRSLQKSGSNLKPQNKSTSFRSMINVSSNQVNYQEILCTVVIVTLEWLIILLFITFTVHHLKSNNRIFYDYK